jgi:RES domain-containing protein
MRLFRLSSWPGLGGQGGLQVDGRWHGKGRPVLYVSEHPALSMVEVMAHMRLRMSNIPLTLKLIRIEVADGASIAPAPPLPSNWQANEPTSQAVGNAWLAGAASLLLPVPSALLAHSTNYLINPAHPEATTHLAETEILPFWFDKRFLR